jgi:hypothetical protein
MPTVGALTERELTPAIKHRTVRVITMRIVKHVVLFIKVFLTSQHTPPLTKLTPDNDYNLF